MQPSLVEPFRYGADRPGDYGRSVNDGGGISARRNFHGRGRAQGSPKFRSDRIAERSKALSRLAALEGSRAHAGTGLKAKFSLPGFHLSAAAA